MKTEIIKHAIVGVGFGAIMHLPAFMAQDNVEVVALCDSGSGRASKAATKGVMPYSNWLDMINEIKPDSISVATPPDSHLDIVTTALERGIHVLCEKPFGLSAAEAKQMTEMARSKGCIGALDFQFRYEPGIIALKKYIDQQSIGRLRRLDVSWLTDGRADPERPWSWQHDSRQGGGVINAFLTHILDLIYWILNEEAHRVISSCRVLIDSRTDRDGRKRPVTAEDQVDAIMDFDSGVVSNIRVGNCQAEGTGMCIEAFGEKGRIVLNHQWPFTLDDITLRLFYKGSAINIEIQKKALSLRGDSRLGAGVALIRDFCRSIEKGTHAARLPVFADGLKVWRTVESLHERNTVR